MMFVHPHAHATDPHWANVAALLHCDGSFADERGHTFSASGNAAASATQRKFGSMSGSFDGSGDYIYAARSDDWDFASDDFTVEFFVYPTSIPLSEGLSVLINKMQGQVAAGQSLGLMMDTSLQVNLFISDGTNAYQVVQATTATLALNTWNWIALSRNSNTWRLLMDGVVALTVTHSGAVGHFTGANGTFGGIGLGGYGATDGSIPLIGELGKYPLLGYIDELRITKGVGRYTGAAAIPAVPFPNGGA